MSDVWTDPSYSTSASIGRVVTSSLFGFFLVGVDAYLMGTDTAKRVAGAEGGLLFQIVHATTWPVAGVFSGFVAGYRAAGRGAIAGALSGLWVAILVGGFLFYLFRRSVDPLILPPTASLLLGGALILAVAGAGFGGWYGDAYYREAGDQEDPSRHTLFRVPWWHWTWLLLFLPGVMLYDVVLSGHLLVLSLIAFFRHFLFTDGSEYGIAAMIGFVVTGLGSSNLWDALAVNSDLAVGRRIAKALGGLVLLVALVPLVWWIASRLLIGALK